MQCNATQRNAAQRSAAQRRARQGNAMLHAASKRKVENDDEFTAKAKLQAASRGRGHADEECQHTLSRNTKLKASSKKV